MKRGKKRHLMRQELRNFWKNLDGRTREIMMRANSISGKGIGRRRSKKQKQERG